MKKRLLSGIAMMLLATAAAQAGGVLTNTNQSVNFLRNPARDAAIGIDGVYFNPAGVAFMSPGLHLGLGIQNVHQTRSVTTTFQPFAFGLQNGGQTTKQFKGKADAPVLPNLHAAYNTSHWSFQFGFGVIGGGGKCKFEQGLPSFESTVAMLPVLSQNLDVLSTQLGMGPLGLPRVEQYDMETYMRGRQYYYGFTWGSAYKANDHWSFYAGLRMLYGRANYYGYVRNMQGSIGGHTFPASDTFKQQAYETFEAAGQAEQAGQTQAAQKATLAGTMLAAFGQATEDVTLNCNQDGWGVAPILGVDFRTGAFNFAAKYEFKTRMRLGNESANSASAKNLAMLDRYADEKSIPEDSPALLTLGAQWSIIPQLRLNAGWHHYFDKDGHMYDNHQNKLKHDTNEWLLGVEYDLSRVVELSAGGQLTRYGFTDDYMEDLSFNVNSYSFGLGVGIRLSDKVKLNAAYFRTNYETYNRTTNNYNHLTAMAGNIVGGVVQNIADPATAQQAVQTTSNTLLQSGILNGKDSFTRTNRVIGLGVELSF